METVSCSISFLHDTSATTGDKTETIELFSLSHCCVHNTYTHTIPLLAIFLSVLKIVSCHHKSFALPSVFKKTAFATQCVRVTKERHGKRRKQRTVIEMKWNYLKTLDKWRSKRSKKEWKVKSVHVLSGQGRANMHSKQSSIWFPLFSSFQAVYLFTNTHAPRLWIEFTWRANQTWTWRTLLLGLKFYSFSALKANWNPLTVFDVILVRHGINDHMW